MTLNTVVVVSCVLVWLCGCAVTADAAVTPIPVVVDTDIGSDFDDSAALALLLQAEEYDVKLMYGGGSVLCGCPQLNTNKKRLLVP